MRSRSRVAAAVSVSWSSAICAWSPACGARCSAAGAAQLVFLVLFSYAFFFQGMTGLAITIGAVVTLFVMMQMTARVSWDDVFAGPGRTRARAMEAGDAGR